MMWMQQRCSTLPRMWAWQISADCQENSSNAGHMIATANNILALGNRENKCSDSPQHAALDHVLAAIKPEARLAALESIQGRVADLMFVELLFEKGPREVDMILQEYNWKKAVFMKRQEALDAAMPEGCAEDHRNEGTSGMLLFPSAQSSLPHAFNPIQF
jgi:hypothetical protein